MPRYTTKQEIGGYVVDLGQPEVAAAEPEPPVILTGGVYEPGVDPPPEPEPTIDGDALAALPFVNRLTTDLGQQCEFIENERGRTTSMVPPRNLSGVEQCPRVARFRLRAMTSSGSRSGNYCLSHVLAEIDRSPREQERLTRWLVRNA